MPLSFPLLRITPRHPYWVGQAANRPAIPPPPLSDLGCTVLYNVRYLDALYDPLFPRPAMIPLSPVLHHRSSVLRNSLDIRPASFHAFVPALG